MSDYEIDRVEEMLAYAPEYYRESKFYTSQNYAKGEEFNIIHYLMNDLPNQMNPATATWGIWLWEEYLGIPSNPNEGLESRRLAVMMKYSHIQLITPISMERIIKKIALANVDIIRNVAPYTFRVRIRDDSVDCDTGLIRSLLEEYKEAHMAYNLAIFLGIIENREVFTARVRHRLAMFWYHGYGAILNGEYNLDGSYLLGTEFPPYMRIYNRLKVNHLESFLLKGIRNKFGVRHGNKYMPVLRNRFDIYWWGDYNYLLNGRYSLDGTWSLMGRLPQIFRKIYIRSVMPVLERFYGRTINRIGAVKNAESVHITTLHRDVFYWWERGKLLTGKHNLDGTWTLGADLASRWGRTTNRLKNYITSHYLAREKYHLEQKNSISEMRSRTVSRLPVYWWEVDKMLNGRRDLDGTWILDGRLINQGMRSKSRFAVTGSSAFKFSSQYIRATVSDMSRIEMKLVNRFFVYWWGEEKLLNGQRSLDGTWILNGGVAEAKVKETHRMKLNTEESFKPSVTIKRKSWCLDGSYNLDGTKILSGDFLYKEEC